MYSKVHLTNRPNVIRLENNRSIVVVKHVEFRELRESQQLLTRCQRVYDPTPNDNPPSFV